MSTYILNHVLVDIYHVYEDLYYGLGTLSMTRNCTIYRNTFTMIIDISNMYEDLLLYLGIMYLSLGIYLPKPGDFEHAI
jgi:hypothetical protein